MILNCHGISKAFGEKIIVKDGTFYIEDHEKVALVGINGAGKSTILKMIVGELDKDAGTVTMTKEKSLGYLAQTQDLTGDNTIYEEVKTAKQPIIDMENKIRELEIRMKSLSGQELEAVMHSYHLLSTEYDRLNGYAYESEITGVLKGLGFDESEFSKPVGKLSGGQKTRVSLGKLLLTKPDLLLLDEPTNHLDLQSIVWLENYLTNYAGAVLIVSHDRYFLDHVVNKVVEIELGALRSYQGNYTAFAEKKQMLRDAQLKAYFNQQQEIKHQEAVIEKLKSFNREKSIKRAESREKQLSKVEVLEKPQELNSNIKLTLEPAKISGNDVLQVEDMSKSFGSHLLFDHVSFEIKRGEHVAIIGDNGTGKTTLLKILTQEQAASSGTFRLGSNVQVGYFDQEHQVLDMDKTIFEEISDTYPLLSNTRIRNVLAAFLFTSDDVFKRIGDLSGGEQGRVSLAKLMLSYANFLILDEPTNHLDITSKEILEHALNEYTGTVLYVSHDRYFINQTASRILELNNQNFINYIGNYDYYLEKKDLLNAINLADKAEHTSDATELNINEATETANKLDWQEQKRLKALERKRKKDLEQTEADIAEHEEEIDFLDQEMTKEEVYTNSVKCQEIATKKATLSKELELLYEKWEELAADED